MSLGELLVDLSRLLGEPAKNREEIYALLERNEGLAEYEVARFFVSKKLAPDLASGLRSVDPRERLAAIRSVALVATRNHAAKLLRSVFKDPDPTARAHARHVMRKLRIDDVALKDPRFKPDRLWNKGPYAPGAYNPSGWAFGVYGRKTLGGTRKSVLGRHQLPPLTTRAEVRALLGLASEGALRALLRPGTAPGSAYVEFEVAKATGGSRRIAAPKHPLRAAQRTILAAILAKVPVHEAAHGFVPERSTVTNATPHLKAALVLKMDLVDFFPTIHYRRVLGLFEQLGYATEAAATLAALCTYRPKLADGDMAWPGLLPQGAPTSPAITNLTCRRLDARLGALAAKAGAVYTRYADDLTFSFAKEPDKVGRFLWWVDQICQQEGFTENTKKRRVLRRSCQQRVTGIVVNEHLAVPRKDRRRFRAIVANVKKNGLAAEARGNDDFEAYLHGYAAYMLMVDPELGARLVRDVREAVGRGEP